MNNEIKWNQGFPPKKEFQAEDGKFFRAIIQHWENKSNLSECTLTTLDDGYGFEDGGELSYNYGIIMWRNID